VLVSNKKSALYLKSYFKQIGLTQIVICPGSRNLPLIVNFSNDPDFKVYSIIDERVAGFFALGLTKASRKPTAVITTSGSAALNLAPAMAEAYYQRLSLIAITADRPEERIEKGENQTIVQKGLFTNYVSYEMELEEKISFNLFEKNIQSLHQFLFQSPNSGNVHINLPFSEPLDSVEHLLGEFKINVSFKKGNPKLNLDSKIAIQKGQNVIIYLSSFQEDLQLNQLLKDGVLNKNWVVISELHSGWKHKNLISQIDLILSGDRIVYKPDILITIGETMLSKKFRNYIRSLEGLKHIDVSNSTRNWDTLSSDYKNIIYNHNIAQILDFENTHSFQSSWLEAEIKANDYLKNRCQPVIYQEFSLVHNIINSIDNQSFIFWGNSSLIRYANWSNWKERAQLSHLSNRGVSGIEGVLATAIGYQSFIGTDDFYCFLGDISLLYETNSLSVLKYVDNFKILVLNNHGGRIFNQIHNWETLGETNALVTPHAASFEVLAKLYDIDYMKVNDLNSFLAQFSYLKSQKGKILFEINLTDADWVSWKDYFNEFGSNY
jgi:2-succinyl-5-enolpyruvyl-6-hydroxy-3-cyclohexene-1-carboxylate synthase